MRRLVLIALFLLASTHGFAQALVPHANVFARGVNASGPSSWMERGAGRMNGGGDSTELFVTAYAGVDWSPAYWLNVHASGVGRHEPGSYEGSRGGLLEAYADMNLTAGREQFRLRGGYFFLPTSRENRNDLWASPYTLSFSAINSWIGEEFRPIGADLEWKHLASAGVLTAAATAFRGNDTAGTLLAWRGWSVGDRLTAYGETLPLPPLRSLRENFVFQTDGTTPFRDDLDGRTGYAGRVRWSQPGVMTVQAAHVDNRGDRLLYGDEYSWKTRFTIVGADFGNLEKTSVATEYLRGATYMGLPFWKANVDADFDAFYVLVSQKLGRNRFSARFDRFATREGDHSRAERNDEDGRSWTMTWLYDVRPHIRAGVEFTQVTGDRPGNIESGLPTQFDGRSVTAELRYVY